MSDDEEPKLYRVDTVPPPAGESDAYNAPTKVGPMAASVVAEMMKAAEKAAANVNAAAAAKVVTPEANIAATTKVKSFADRAVVSEIPPPGDVPRVYDSRAEADDDDDDNEDAAATMVNSLSKPPAVDPLPPAPPPALVFDERPPPSAGRLAPPPIASFAPPPEEPGLGRSWIDYLLVLIILGAAGGAIYLLRR